MQAKLVMVDSLRMKAPRFTDEYLLSCLDELERILADGELAKEDRLKLERRVQFLKMLHFARAMEPKLANWVNLVQRCRDLFSSLPKPSEQARTTPFIAFP